MSNFVSEQVHSLLCVESLTGALLDSRLEKLGFSDLGFSLVNERYEFVTLRVLFDDFSLDRLFKALTSFP
jgi:hypothetical protein